MKAGDEKKRDEKREVKRLEVRIKRLRRTLLEIAYSTQCRRAYDLATEALGIRNADEVKRRAKKEGICR